ncbi:hypothetical protein UPYG_G00050710 [Umbra pygmaea]|uniref:Immunoglobulin V-set domain-containing protein n=1 Tax=Umbra pygmaea TaxID=75934 RepID=A0ABD0X7R3_UMBPY
MEKVFITTVYILLALCPAESQGLEVTGYAGGKVDITCSHYYASTNNKYFCNGACHDEDILIKTGDNKNTMTKEKYSISDFRDGSFIVTIKYLNKSDSGTYWCGVDRVGLDTYTKVYLTVRSAQEYVSPGSRCLTTTQPPNVSSMPVLGTPGIIMVCVSLALLLLGLILLLIYKRKRDRKASKSVTNPATTTQDNIYQTLNIATIDSIYQTLSLRTQDIPTKPNTTLNECTPSKP